MPDIDCSKCSDGCLESSAELMPAAINLPAPKTYISSSQLPCLVDLEIKQLLPMEAFATIDT